MAPKAKTTRVFLKVACAYAALTLFLASPLLMSLGSRVPVDDGDPLFNTWVMAWNGHALLTNPLELFSANIYYPYSDTLAYSDLLLVPSLAALPLNLIFGNPLVAYNLLFLLSFVFSGLAMFLLARLLTGSAPTAFFAGLAYAFSTYRISQMGHFQLLTDGLMVMMVYFAHTYLRTHRLRDILLAGVCLAFQALTSWYYGFYAAFLLAAFLVFYAGAKDLKLNKRLIVHLTCLGALSGAIIGPFALPYLRLRASMPGFSRTLGEAVYFSARWSDYFSTKNPFLLKLAGGSWVSSGANMWEHLLWPGLFAIGFSVGGLFLRRLPRAALAADEGRTRLFYLLICLFAFVFSLGPFLWVAGFRLSLPYLGAWWFVPGFKAMRVPARFGALVTFSLVILAAYGFRDTVGWLKGRFALSRAVEYSAGAALAIVMIATQVNGFFLLSGPVASATGDRSVYAWLAGKGEGVVVELPSVDVKGGAVVGGWSRDVRYLLGSTRHWRKLVNGYSGYAPPEYGRIMEAVGLFPGGDSIAVMQALRIDYLVYHTGGDRRLAKVLTVRAKKSPAVSFVKRYGDDLLFAIKPAGYPVLGPITRPIGRRPPLTALLARPGPVSPGKAVNLAWKVKNSTGKAVVVGIDEQPVAYYSWDGGADKPVWPRLPMVLKAGRTAWMETQLEGPPLPGAQRLRLKLRSPLIKPGNDNLTIEARAGMMTSLKGDGLGGRFGKVVMARTAKAADDLAATVTVKNTGKALWVSRFDPSTALELPYDKGEVHIAAFWHTAAGRQVGEPQVFKLAHDLGPGQTYTDILPLKAPRRPGAYRVRLDLVDLGVAWFKDLGTVGPSFRIRVR